MPITAVPNAGAFVGGLINVRGRVVPLADLQGDVRHGPAAEPDAGHADRRHGDRLDGEPTVAGILADKVHEVTDIEAAAIEEAPQGRHALAGRNSSRGIGKRDDDFIIIPDMERIFGAEGGRNRRPWSE